MEKIINDIIDKIEKSINLAIRDFLAGKITEEQFLTTFEYVTNPVLKIILGGSDEMRELRSKIYISPNLKTLIEKSDRIDIPLEKDRFIEYIKNNK